MMSSGSRANVIVFAMPNSPLFDLAPLGVAPNCQRLAKYSIAERFCQAAPLKEPEQQCLGLPFLPSRPFEQDCPALSRDQTLALTPKPVAHPLDEPKHSLLNLLSPAPPYYGSDQQRNKGHDPPHRLDLGGVGPDPHRDKDPQ
jgi:hypothetical protein